MQSRFPYKNEEEQENCDKSYDYNFNEQENYNNLNNSFEFHFGNYYGESNNYFSSYNFGFESHNIDPDNNNLFNNNLEEIMNNPNQINLDVNIETEPLGPEKKENKKVNIPIEERITSQASLQKSEINNNLNNKEINKNQININNNDINIIIPLTKERKKNLQKNRGRKRKGDKSEREHNKFKKDDKMRKIKSKIIQFIPKYINITLSLEHKKFLKIDKKVNENLERGYNIDLMNMTLKRIFINNSINGRYSKYKYRKNYNAELVEEIYSKGEEKKAIERLNQTYIEVVDIIRKNYFSEFKEEILRKEIKNGENREIAKIYVNEIGNLLLNYEDWFYGKIPKK